MALVTYDDAVRHLKQDGVLDGSPADADLTLKIEQASALVLIHLKRPAEWTVDSIAADDPEFAIVQAAVFRVLGNLYRFRGDDDGAPAPIDDAVVSMLSMLRDPSLA